MPAGRKSGPSSTGALRRCARQNLGHGHRSALVRPGCYTYYILAGACTCDASCANGASGWSTGRSAPGSAGRADARGRLRTGRDSLEECRADQSASGLSGPPRALPELRIRDLGSGTHRGADEIERAARDFAESTPRDGWDLCAGSDAIFPSRSGPIYDEVTFSASPPAQGSILSGMPSERRWRAVDDARDITEESRFRWQGVTDDDSRGCEDCRGHSSETAWSRRRVLGSGCYRTREGHCRTAYGTLGRTAASGTATQ